MFFPFRTIAFFAGAILAVLLGLSFYDQDVLTVDNVLSFMATLGTSSLRSDSIIYISVWHGKKNTWDAGTVNSVCVNETTWQYLTQLPMVLS